MMKAIVSIMGLLFALQLFARQTDSTDIKLRQYKDYFDKGLITLHDYDLLKERLLHLGDFSPPARAHRKVPAGPRQYDKNETFEVRIEPVGYFDLLCQSHQPYVNNSGQLYEIKPKLPLQRYGGLHVGLGGAIKKRYHMHLMMGFDGNHTNQFFTLGPDFNANLLAGRISPFVHAGGGYTCITGSNDNSVTSYSFGGAVNGCFAVTGIGLYARLNKFFAINISPDYRFVYAGFKTRFIGQNQNPQLGVPFTGSYNFLFQQLGLRIAAVFY